MSLRQEIVEWQQPDLLVVPKQEKQGTENPDTTGNGLLYFSLYMILLVRRGEARKEDLEQFESVVKECEQSRGILNRSKTKGSSEQTAKDDYIGVTTAAKALHSKYAAIILDAGNVRRFGLMKWFYKNANPDHFQFFDFKWFGFKSWKPWTWFNLFHMDTARAWMGKNPEVISHMQFAAYVRPHCLRIIWQAIYLCVTSVKNASLVNLNHLMIETAKEQSDLIRLAGDFWAYRVGRQWKGGLKEALSHELHPDHPIVKYWID